MRRTISVKSVCANPEEGINEKKSFLCVDDGVPLMYKQKITAFFIKNPVFPISVKMCPLLLGLVYVQFLFCYVHIPNGNSHLLLWA